MPNRIKIVSHRTLDNAPPGYMVVEIEVGDFFKIQAERNPHTKGEFRWPDGFNPTERLTKTLNALHYALEFPDAVCVQFRNTD